MGGRGCRIYNNILLTVVYGREWGLFVFRYFFLIFLRMGLVPRLVVLPTMAVLSIPIRRLCGVDRVRLATLLPVNAPRVARVTGDRVCMPQYSAVYRAVILTVQVYM